MKVGIYTGRQTGGGHTFQTEILLALSEMVEESHHSYVFLASSMKFAESLQPYIKSPRIQVLVIPKERLSTSAPAQKVQQIFDVVRSKFGWSSGNSSNMPAIENPIDYVANSQGIELIWFLDQRYRNIPDTPYIATLWDLQHRLQPYFPEVSEGSIWDVREAGLSRYLRKSAFVITGSKTAQAEIGFFYQVPSERIKILPHPTPQFALASAESDDEEVLQRFGLSKGFLFYPAQFWAHKNHMNLLLALQLLREKFNLTFHMVFVGADTGNEAYIRQQVDNLNLSSYVHILGFVSQEDLVSLYRSAFALTYMTFFGPDNLPPLEAFALGCPVVASKVSGAEEQLGNAALLVNPKKPNEIANAIIKLHRDAKLRSTLIKRGQQRASSWTSHDFVRGVYKILDEFELVRRCWP